MCKFEQNLVERLDLLIHAVSHCFYASHDKRNNSSLLYPEDGETVQDYADRRSEMVEQTRADALRSEASASRRSGGCRSSSSAGMPLSGCRRWRRRGQRRESRRWFRHCHLRRSVGRSLGLVHISMCANCRNSSASPHSIPMDRYHYTPPVSRNSSCYRHNHKPTQLIRYTLGKDNLRALVVAYLIDLKHFLQKH